MRAWRSWKRLERCVGRGQEGWRAYREGQKRWRSGIFGSLSAGQLYCSRHLCEGRWCLGHHWCGGDDGGGGFLVGMNCLTWGGVSGVLWVRWHHAKGHAGSWWPGNRIPGDGLGEEPPLRSFAAPSGAAMTQARPAGSAVLVTKIGHNEAPERGCRGSNRGFWRSQWSGVAHSAGQVGWAGTSEHCALVSCSVTLSVETNRVNLGFRVREEVACPFRLAFLVQSGLILFFLLCSF